jgi:hypothetical protein
MAALYEYGGADYGISNISNAPTFAFEVTNDYIIDASSINMAHETSIAKEKNDSTSKAVIVDNFS